MQIYNIPLNKDKKEITSHGNRAFPIAVYEQELKKNILGFIPWHWHEELQFCYIVKGIVKFHISNQIVLLEKGQGVFISSNILHMADSDDADSGAYICIDVKPIFLSNYADSIIAQKYIYPILHNSMFSFFVFSDADTHGRKILEELRQIYLSYIHKNSGYEIDIQISLLSVWKIMFLHLNQQANEKRLVSQKDNERIKQIMSYIHDHFSLQITLDDIAAYVNLSKNECCRAFKKYTGDSIFTYITNYRILESEKLLLTTNWPINVIANICGFNSSSYYTKTFKLRKNMTPKEFRDGKNRRTLPVPDI